MTDQALRFTDDERRRSEPVRTPVLRIYHSAIIAGWRKRDQELERHGYSALLVSPYKQFEGGSTVALSLRAEHSVIPIRTFGYHPIFFIWSPGPLYSVLRRRRYAVIDIHEEPYSLATAEILLLLRLARVASPIVMASSQGKFRRYPIPFRILERWAFSSADGCYALDQATEDNVRRKGFRGDIRIIALGVDLDAFSPAPERRNDPVRVGYAGRLEHEKGVHIAVKALASSQGWDLDIAGAGSEERHLRDLAERLGVSPRVHFHGALPHEAMPGWLQRVDALIAPSLHTSTWYEKYGRTVIEAMATGLPVVASTSGNLPTLLGDAGLLVPPADASSLAAALSDLVTSPVQRRELGVRARRRAETMSWARVALAQAALYDSAIAAWRIRRAR